MSGREVKKRGGARPQSTAKKALKERWLAELKKIVNKKNVHAHPMYPSLKIISAKMKRMKLGLLERQPFGPGSTSSVLLPRKR